MMLAHAIDASAKANGNGNLASWAIQCSDMKNERVPFEEKCADSRKPLSFGLRHEYAQLVEQIALGLENLAKLNSSFTGGNDDVFLKFSCSQAPSMSLNEYLQRLTTSLDRWKNEEKCGIRALIMSLVYIERLYRLYPVARLSSTTVHKLLLVSMLSATKFSEDRKISHNFWARAGGVELEELNALEREFCKLLCFDFYIPKSEFRSCNLEKIAESLV